MRTLRGAAGGGPGGWVVAVQLAALTWVALAVTGCETTAQKSARLERAAHSHVLSRQQGLRITRVNSAVKVVGAETVSDANGTAAVVTLRNEASRILKEVPVAITLRDARGAVLYQNNAPGLDPTLVAVGALKPHTETVWIDDQIQAAAKPARVEVKVGESPTAGASAAQQVAVTGVKTFADPANGEGAEGEVLNGSGVAQQKLVVFVVGRRAGHVVAAGRAVLPEAPAGQRSPSQVFFIGSPRGARLEASAPATTLNSGHGR